MKRFLYASSSVKMNEDGSWHAQGSAARHDLHAVATVVDNDGQFDAFRFMRKPVRHRVLKACDSLQAHLGQGRTL